VIVKDFRCQGRGRVEPYVTRDRWPRVDIIVFDEGGWRVSIPGRLCVLAVSDAVRAVADQLLHAELLDIAPAPMRSSV